MHYCKTIELSDYEQTDSFQHIANIKAIFDMRQAPYGWGHAHRQWEYGIVLSALRENGTKTVLDVGGGGSIFAASAKWVGMDVLQLDPGYWEDTINAQSQKLNMQLPYVQTDLFEFPDPSVPYAEWNPYSGPSYYYDAVVCISVIEHVPNHFTFFDKLQKHVKPNGLLCLTTDFHPSGVGIFDGHNRTYNAEMMTDLIEIAQGNGFEVFGDEPDYQHFETFIFDLYSFACLVMKKI